MGSKKTDKGIVSVKDDWQEHHVSARTRVEVPTESC